MKPCFYIGIFLLLVCSSCRDDVHIVSPTPDPVLVEIDSLMWRQPDSALSLLIPCFDTGIGGDAKFCVSTATEYDRHYANLLLAELLYKNDYGQTNREELREAVDYFDSYFLSARALYINGVGYYERDSVAEACEEYLKAVEIMENRFPTVETMCTSSHTSRGSWHMSITVSGICFPNSI